MASMTMTVPQPPYGTQPFLYYTPNSKADNRSHALFSPHPRGASANATHQGPHQSQTPSLTGYSTLHPPKRLLPQTPNFTRPTAAPGMTMASPRPVGQKPTIVIQNEAGSRPPFRHVNGGVEVDSYLSPATPPLSLSGSVIGSPLSAGGSLLTPHDSAVFARHDLGD